MGRALQLVEEICTAMQNRYRLVGAYYLPGTMVSALNGALLAPSREGEISAIVDRLENGEIPRYPDDPHDEMEAAK